MSNNNTITATTIAENNDNRHINGFEHLNDSQKRFMYIMVRVGGCISLLCSAFLVYSVLSNPSKRKRIFHRIMMGCACNIIILNLNLLWGQLAVPIEFQELGFPLARGNQATCSSQGFLYTMGFVVPSYYVALSLISFFAIRNKFKVQKYVWIEKYIHVGVYLFPLASGAYLLSVEAYNPGYTDCYFVSLPKGCGKEGDVECIRGPDNYGMLARWLIAFPVGVILLFPTVLLTYQYIVMRFWSDHGSAARRVAASMGQQASLYLLALYWTYFFRIVYLIAYFKFGVYMFALHVLSNTMEFMQGVWISCAYWYLKSDSDPIFILQLYSAVTSSSSASRIETQTPQPKRRSRLKRRHPQRQQQQREEEEIVFQKTLNLDSLGGFTSTTVAKVDSGDEEDAMLDDAKRISKGEPSTTTKRNDPATCYSDRSFRIFDGSSSIDPDSPWSAFLMEDDGEDEDYQNDCGEYDDSVFDMQAEKPKKPSPAI